MGCGWRGRGEWIGSVKKRIAEIDESGTRKQTVEKFVDNLQNSQVFFFVLLIAIQILSL